MKKDWQIVKSGLAQFLTLPPEERRIVAEKVLELANLSFAGLVLSQVLTNTASIKAMATGAFLFIFLSTFSILYLKKGQHE